MGLLGARTLLPGVLAVLLSLGTTACGGEGSDAGPAPAATVTVTVSATAIAVPTDVTAAPASEDTSPPATTAAGGRPDLQPGAFEDVTPEVDGGANFRSPTGNIQCAVVPSDDGPDPFVQCEVSEADWSVPEEACDLDWIGTEVSLSDEVRAGGCRGDTFLVEDPFTLEYGEGWAVGALTCVSREDGVLCARSDTGSGFLVSRASLTLF